MRHAGKQIAGRCPKPLLCGIGLRHQGRSMELHRRFKEFRAQALEFLVHPEGELMLRGIFGKGRRKDLRHNTVRAASFGHPLPADPDLFIELAKALPGAQPVFLREAPHEVELIEHVVDLLLNCGAEGIDHADPHDGLNEPAAVAAAPERRR